MPSYFTNLTTALVLALIGGCGQRDYSVGELEKQAKYSIAVQTLSLNIHPYQVIFPATNQTDIGTQMMNAQSEAAKVKLKLRQLEEKLGKADYPDTVAHRLLQARATAWRVRSDNYVSAFAVWKRRQASNSFQVPKNDTWYLLPADLPTLTTSQGSDITQVKARLSQIVRDAPDSVYASVAQ